MRGVGQGFRDWFCPCCAGAAALGSLQRLQHSGKEPGQGCGWCHARGFSGMPFAYGCTVVYIVLGEKSVFQPGCCLDPHHGDRAGDILSPAELQLLVW